MGVQWKTIKAVVPAGVAFLLAILRLPASVLPADGQGRAAQKVAPQSRLKMGAVLLSSMD